jgi:hypothetical protein
MTVDGMLSGMSSIELTEWMAYYELEPFGEERADLRAGSIAAPLLNLWLSEAKMKDAKDWIMHSDDLVEDDDLDEQDEEDMKAVLKAFAAAAKG